MSTLWTASCVITTHAHSNIEAVNTEAISVGLRNITAEKIYALKTSPDICNRRKVVVELTRQIKVAIYEN